VRTPRIGRTETNPRRIAVWMSPALWTTLTMLGHNTAVFFPVAVGLFVAGVFGVPALARRLRPTNDQRPTTNDER